MEINNPQNIETGLIKQTMQIETLLISKSFRTLMEKHGLYKFSKG